MSDVISDNSSLKNTLGNFVTSYTGRDKSIAFSKWFSDRLQQEMPDMPSGSSEKLSKEIIEGVKAYDQTLADLNAAIESGQSKEEWLAERTAEAYTDMPFNSAGNILSKVYDDLDTVNTGLMREIEETHENDVTDVTNEEIDTVEAETVEWNKYSVKSKALDIGKQAVMSGLAVAAGTIKNNIESGELVDVDNLIGQTLQEGLETAKGEVKAVVAGAIKTAAENGLTDILPADTPTEVICDIAGVAVESAEALFDAATGKISMTEALDKTGRAGVVTGCRLARKVIKGVLASIPVVGPLVVEFAGGLLDHMKSPKFAENVYTVVRDAAKATWEGIKQTGRNILNRLMNRTTEQLHN